MNYECLKPVIPRIKEYPSQTRKEIALGDVPDGANFGPWRPIQPQDKAHPGHILGILNTRMEMVPIRLYGPGEEICVPKITEMTAVEGQEFDLAELEAGTTSATLDAQSRTTS